MIDLAALEKLFGLKVFSGKNSFFVYYEGANPQKWCFYASPCGNLILESEPICVSGLNTSLQFEIYMRLGVEYYEVLIQFDRSGIQRI